MKFIEKNLGLKSLTILARPQNEIFYVYNTT